MNLRTCTALAVAVGLSACATNQERAARSALDALPMPTIVDSDENARSAPALPDFTALVAEAARRSPAIRSAWYEARAAAIAIPIARELPSPTVTLTGFLSAVETRVGPQRFGVAAAQAFPWPTRLSRAADAASARAAVARRRVERAHRALVRDLRLPWAALARLEAARELVLAQVDVVARVRGVVETRLAVGQSHYADTARLALREVELSERAAGLADEAVAVRANIRARASLPPQTALPAASLPDAVPAPPAAEAVVAAIARSPDVVVREAARAAAEAEVDAAAEAGTPDLSLGLNWTFVDEARMPGVEDSGKDVLALMVGVRLPLWGAYSEREEAAQARELAAEASVSATRDAAIGQILAWSSGLERARRRLALYNETLPASAESALAATLDAYGVGRASLRDVLQLEEKLLAYRLEALEARAAAATLAARIDYHLAAEAPPEGAAP